MPQAKGELLDISVLYVEDEMITRKIVCDILQRRFKNVYQAKDGREGLEIFMLHGPQIVVTDSRMPLMNGFDMARAIKEIKPETPIIFTSACEDCDFRNKIKEIGIVGNVAKPIVVKELLELLENISSNLPVH
jgi:YesN/AraC family two-component response regulator